MLSEGPSEGPSERPAPPRASPGSLPKNVPQSLPGILQKPSRSLPRAFQESPVYVCCLLLFFDHVLISWCLVGSYPDEK